MEPSKPPFSIFCITLSQLAKMGAVVVIITAFLFNSQVYNVVPSISAITGVSPQRYIWRICIAFHLGPRLLIGCLYYRYHQERTSHITEEKVNSIFIYYFQPFYHVDNEVWAKKKPLCRTLTRLEDGEVDHVENGGDKPNFQWSTLALNWKYWKSSTVFGISEAYLIIYR